MSQAYFEYISHFYHTTRRYIPKHNHACYELVYYCEGCGETTINTGTPLKYSPNTYIIYNPFDYHTEVHHTDTLVYCLGFHLDSRSPLHPVSGLHKDEDNSIFSLVLQLSKEIEQKLTFYNLLAELFLNQILIIHHRNLGAHQDKNYSLQYAVKFLDENFSQDINLTTLAEMSGYSYDYFRHLFTECIGISPKKYIISKRISHAKQLLKNENLSIAEISHLSGFSCLSQFSSIFKNYVGMSPTQYKKRYYNLQLDVTNLSEK